ncbi:MAG: hypothetical protein NT178_01470 [Proteobacteria bacterium]|nr:hypothetical protein [Pseudomonadota bacterium]
MLADRDLKSRNIIAGIKTVYHDNYENDDTKTVNMVLKDVVDLFKGKRKGFQKCDVKYHNIYHTLQTIPPFVEIIDGWNKSGNPLRISKEYFDLGIVAVLLHDTGYIKTEDDNAGTGAKYTFTHIQRSIDFTDQYLHQAGFDEYSILHIKHAIACTGVNYSPVDIRFSSEEEQVIGYTLGTADLLGQMASPDYPRKLPLLFKEFEEAYRFENTEKLLGIGIKLFNNADELVKNTQYFYKKVAMNRFLKMGSMYKYLTYHFGTLNNPYIEAIEENIRKIQALFP